MEGITQYVVVECDSMTDNHMYNQSIKWLKKTMNKPDEAIITTIENELIRFKFLMPNSIKVMGVPFDMMYTVEIAFKKGKYKFELIKVEGRNGAASPSFGTVYPNNNWTGYFKKGELKRIWREYEKIPMHLNDMNHNLKDYLTAIETIKDDW